MDFLTSTILSGVAWDGIKQIGELTGRYLLSKLRDWIVDETTCDKIAERINSMPKEFKKNEKFIKVYIDEDKELLSMLQTIKNGTNYVQNNSGSEIKESSVVVGENNNTTTTITNNYNYYPFTNQNSDNEKKVAINSYHSRGEIRKEIVKILMENNAVYKLYGPTEQNKRDLFSKKADIWNIKALDTIIPNNNKIIRLLEENDSILTEEEYEIFIRFKLHAQGFEANHKTKEKLDEYPLFPSEINNILR